MYCSIPLLFASHVDLGIIIPFTIKKITVDLISLFSWVYAPSMKLRDTKFYLPILTPAPHAPVTGDQHVVEASNNAISSIIMRFHDDRACDSSLLCARQLGFGDLQN